MSWKANWPSLVVTVLWSRPVATSVALTCAFGTTAPDGSLTVPLMAPRNVWALAAIVTLSRTNKLKSRNLIAHPFVRIRNPLLSVSGDTLWDDQQTRSLAKNLGGSIDAKHNTAALSRCQAANLGANQGLKL